MLYSCMKLNSYGRGALYKKYYPLKDLRKVVWDRKGISAEDSQGERLIWQNEIRFVLLLHKMQRAIPLITSNYYMYLIYVNLRDRLSLSFFVKYSRGSTNIKK